MFSGRVQRSCFKDFLNFPADAHAAPAIMRSPAANYPQGRGNHTFSFKKKYQKELLRKTAFCLWTGQSKADALRQKLFF